MTPETQSMLEKIKKLLTLASDKGATEGERDNAMRFAHKLLAKHNLTMAQVEAAGQKTEERGRLIVTFFGRPWAQSTACSVARLFFSFVVVIPAKRAQDTQFVFVGKESNARTSASMAQYIVESIRKEARRRQRDAEQGNAYGRSFALGAAARIAQRVNEILKESNEQRGDGKSIVLASVYQSELEANRGFIARTMKTRPLGLRGKSEVETEAFVEGAEYGNTVSLNRQIGGTEQPRRIERA